MGHNRGLSFIGSLMKYDADKVAWPVNSNFSTCSPFANHPTRYSGGRHLEKENQKKPVLDVCRLLLATFVYCQYAVSYKHHIQLIAYETPSVNSLDWYS